MKYCGSYHLFSRLSGSVEWVFFSRRQTIHVWLHKTAIVARKMEISPSWFTFLAIKPRIWSFQVFFSVLQRTAKKCSENFPPHAQSHCADHKTVLLAKFVLLSHFVIRPTPNKVSLGQRKIQLYSLNILFIQTIPELFSLWSVPYEDAVYKDLRNEILQVFQVEFNIRAV